MDILLFCINGIMPVILTVALGYCLKRIHLIDTILVVNGNNLCYKVLLPVAVFNNIRDVDFEVYFEPRLVLFALLCMAVITLALVLLVPRFLKQRSTCGAFIQGVIRGNFLLLGFPLATGLFGDAGGMYASMLLPVAVIYFTIASVLVLTYFQGDRQPAKLSLGKLLFNALKSPLLFACAAGAAFSLLKLTLPAFLDKTFDNIGGISLSLALLFLGAQFSFSRLRANLTVAAIATAMRLVFVPLLALGASIACGFRGIQLGVLFVLFCAPTATTTYVMASNLHSNEDLAGQIVVLSTLCSVFTLFAGIYLLRLANLV